MRHAEKWYQRRLAKYFEDCYWSYEDSAKYYTDPDINQWSFEIEEHDQKVHIILTCNEDGSVSEQRFTK